MRGIVVNSGLSRRGLFRALSASTDVAGSPDVMGPDVPSRLVARIGEACVEPRGVACRRCGEACDAGAIRFRPLLGGRFQPVLDAAACSGCDACRAVCPVAAITLISAERLALVGDLVELGRSA
jgi:ferredoxin-type protein NapF